MTLSPRDVPKQWRPAWTVMAMVVGILIAGASGAAAGLAAVRSEAEMVVTRAWSERQRSEVVSIAAEAARQGASQAISEQFQGQIAPLSAELKSHESMDDQRVVDLSRRLDRVETRLDRLDGRLTVR